MRNLNLLVFLALAIITASGCGSAEKSPSPAAPTPPTAAVLCPEGATPPSKFDANTLVGLTPSEAEDKTREFDCTLRTVELDGKPQPVTMDFRTNRDNVALTDDKITKVLGVY